MNRVSKRRKYCRFTALGVDEIPQFRHALLHQGVGLGREILLRMGKGIDPNLVANEAARDIIGRRTDAAPDAG